MSVAINIQSLYSDEFLPVRHSTAASGYDVKSLESMAICSGDIRTIRTGLCLEMPSGWEAQVRPRSGLSANGLLVQFGTIDSDYRGEIRVIIDIGDRIAQLVFSPVYSTRLVPVHELSETERGEGGFGSTGK